MIRQLLLNCDLRLGEWSALRDPAYIREQYLEGGGGVYTAADWSRARSLGYRGVGKDGAELATDESYLRRMFSAHKRNLIAALRIAQVYDFGSHKSVLELGCGEMLQAFVISSAFPHLRYKATDVDPFVIEKCAQLPLLRRVEKGVLDARRVTAADLVGFDLLLSWEMIYALDDVDIVALLSAARSAGTSFLACTTQMTGPLRHLLRALRNLNWRPEGFYYERQVRAGAIRMHGWNPSAGYYAGLAERSGMKLIRVLHPPIATMHGDNFSYLLFQPAG